MKALIFSLLTLSLAAWAQDYSDESNLPPETNVQQQEGQELEEPGAVNHNDSQWEGSEEQEYFEEDLQQQEQDIDPQFDPIDDELTQDESTY